MAQMIYIQRQSARPCVPSRLPEAADWIKAAVRVHNVRPTWKKPARRPYSSDRYHEPGRRSVHRPDYSSRALLKDVMDGREEPCLEPSCQISIRSKLCKHGQSVLGEGKSPPGYVHDENQVMHGHSSEEIHEWELTQHSP